MEVLDTEEPAVLNKRTQYWKNLIKPEYNQGMEAAEKGQEEETQRRIAELNELELQVGGSSAGDPREAKQILKSAEKSLNIEKDNERQIRYERFGDTGETFWQTFRIVKIDPQV